uniref:Myb-like domain-containing protein n=1 Tax=Salix viminalis TaxID=40686 RepID=A0A6N2K1I3_SALVM
MDLFITGDRQIQSPNGFPLQITPFPPTGNFTMPSSAAAPSAAEAGSSEVASLPPQKLRPIRRTGRVPSCSREDGGESLRGLVSGQPSEVAVNYGGGSGGVLFDNEFSSSSSDGNDNDLLVGGGESVGRKRKRKSKIEKFLESLVMKVMDKQEEMHKQLVEMIESRERERVIREEAWKQQEMERMKRDSEARAEETSRNLALISFIQNMTSGHVIEVPQPSMAISHMVDDGGNADAPIQNDFKGGQSNGRWPEAEVQALIMLRTAWEQQSRVAGSDGTNIWDAISAGMYNMGYNRTAKKCREKWENINKHFKMSLGTSPKKPFQDTVSPYFPELDTLYNDDFVNLGNGSANTDNQANCALGNG